MPKVLHEFINHLEDEEFINLIITVTKSNRLCAWGNTLGWEMRATVN